MTQEIEVIWTLQGDTNFRTRRLVVDLSDFDGCLTKKQVEARLAEVIAYEIQRLNSYCNLPAFAEKILFELEEKRLMEGEAA
jgi:hypothetical protein